MICISNKIVIIVCISIYYLIARIQSCVHATWNGISGSEHITFGLFYVHKRYVSYLADCKSRPRRVANIHAVSLCDLHLSCLTRELLTRSLLGICRSISEFSSPALTHLGNFPDVWLSALQVPWRIDVGYPVGRNSFIALEKSRTANPIQPKFYDIISHRPLTLQDRRA